MIFDTLKKLTFSTLFLTLLLEGSAIAQSSAKLHPENGHYFLFRDKPTILVGSSEHYGAVINLDFDYIRYLNELQTCGLNFVRVFAGTYRETPGAFGIADNTLAPATHRSIAPWKRTTIGGASDGGTKFDLNQWDPAYFLRLRDFVQAAGQRNIIVEVTYFCPYYDDSLWNLSPMKSTNHINGVGSGGRGNCFQTNSDLVPYQLAMVRKHAAELKDFDNVVHEVMNEPYNGAVPQTWQNLIINELVNAEAGSATRHMIAQNVANYDATIQNPHPALSIFNFHYAYPNAATQNYGLNRALGDDETGFAGNADFPYRREAWEFMISGGGLFNHLDFSFTTNSEDGRSTASSPGGGGPAIRKQLSILRKFIEAMPFIKMSPQNGIVAGGVPSGGAVRVLGMAGGPYGIYIRGGSQAYLTLVMPGGTYQAEWIDTKSGLTVKTENFTHAGGQRVMTSPTYSEDIALRISPPTQRTLSVNSTPADGIRIVSPTDLKGAGDGTTGFTRTFTNGATVTLGAPGTSGSTYFVKWQKNGTDFSKSNSINITMDSNHTYTAVYSSSPPPRELLVNGSFESGLSNWTPAGNVAARSATPYVPTDGTTLAGFNGGNTTPNGVITQTFSTTPGTTYTLTFDAGVLSYNTLEQKVQVRVAGSAPLISDTVTMRGTGGGNTNWASKSYTFTADRATTTLTFTDVSATTDGLDHLLDNISVTARGTTSAWVNGTPGNFRIGMTATAPGTHVLQRSADMKSWQTVSQIEVTQPGPIEFLDTNSSGKSMFYRVATPP
jgi:hypothetical protein